MAGTLPSLPSRLGGTGAGALSSGPFFVDDIPPAPAPEDHPPDVFKIQIHKQMLILNKKKVDLRVYTFFNKVIYIYPRKNHPDKITTNISQGGRGDPSLLEILPEDLLRKAKKIAVKMAKKSKLNFIGIDIILDRNLKDVYVIDVNTFPGFPKRRTFNLARCMLRELSRLSNKGGLRFKKGCNIYKAGTKNEMLSDCFYKRT